MVSKTSYLDFCLFFTNKAIAVKTIKKSSLILIPGTKRPIFKNGSHAKMLL